MSGSDDRSSRFAKHLDLHAERFRLDLQAARLFVGSTDIGNVAENAVRRFLNSMLPSRYAVGVGEVIAPGGWALQPVNQTQQKDVILYDPYGCAILDWDGYEASLFPVESIYGVLEVKTSLRSKDDLLQAVDQTLEVKKLVQSNRGKKQMAPFTAVFAFESKVLGNTLFEALHERSPDKRADFVLVLNPARSEECEKDDSLYFVHWHYHSRGGGPIDFVSADETTQERSCGHKPKDKYLTFCVSNQALLWFYLFLMKQLDSMKLSKPDLWRYTGAGRTRLGWRRDAS